ncbi:DinB family protein [Pseudofulvibacter geojedonensis]|uniref:DinB family protein n=1 Tax=Pseudofulvibacter geojedonensis TaxID=1123758 RepID=A0ABW3HYK9_9FLAO
MSYQIHPTPNNISCTNTIARMIDGLIFRYYWATEGLTDDDYTFRPVEGSMNLTELHMHIYDLAFITNKTYGGSPTYKKEYLTSFDSARQEILRLYEDVSNRLKEMQDDNQLNEFVVKPKSLDGEFPFWYTLNGHIADCLTHIGQLISWRRINGNPQPKGVNVFLGKQL